MRPATETKDSRMFLRAKTESRRPTNFAALDATAFIGLATAVVGTTFVAAGVFTGAEAGFAATLLVLATLALTSRF